jgi:hypothetical protein
VRPTQQDVHTVGFFRRFPGLDWLEGEIREGRARAGAEFVVGPFDGVVIASEGPSFPTEHQQPSYATSTAVAAKVCDESNQHQFPCNVALVREVLRVASQGRPAEHVGFGLYAVEPGSVGAGWREAASALPTDEVTYSAVGMLAGFPRYQVLVEVTGDDFGSVFDSLERYAGLPGVVAWDALHTTARLTRGFGGEPLP